MHGILSCSFSALSFPTTRMGEDDTDEDGDGLLRGLYTNLRASILLHRLRGLFFASSA
jgi:hypothetical protein